MLTSWDTPTPPPALLPSSMAGAMRFYTFPSWSLPLLASYSFLFVPSGNRGVTELAHIKVGMVD